MRGSVARRGSSARASFEAKPAAKNAAPPTKRVLVTLPNPKDIVRFDIRAGGRYRSAWTGVNPKRRLFAEGAARTLALCNEHGSSLPGGSLDENPALRLRVEGWVDRLVYPSVEERGSPPPRSLAVEKRERAGGASQRKSTETVRRRRSRESARQTYRRTGII